jgi:zinc protease
MIFKYLIYLLSAFVPMATFSQARLVEKVTKKGTEIVIPYEKYILPNGLNVIIHEDHSDPVAHVDVTYHVGSAREEIGKSGFAHFFEHMMFQGSDNVGDDQHFKIVTDAGGTLNGTTNLDRTNYFQTVPSNQVEKMLWLEADRMGFLLDAVTQRKFEIQRSTVKNERGQRYDNVAYGIAREMIAKNLYPYGHPYSWLTIGYVEDLNRVDVNDLKNFFLRWYGPNNATITVGGDVNPKQVLQWVQKYFGSIPRGPEVKPTKPEPVKILSDRFVSYTDRYAKSPQLRIVFPTVPQYHPDEAALDVLVEILGQGRNSMLYQTLVKTLQATNASASHSNNELSGELSISVTPYPGKGLDEMHQLVKDAMVAFEKRGVTDADIERYRNRYEAQVINGLTSVQGKVSRLAAFNTFTGNPNMIGKLLKTYGSVTKADVMRVYNQYLKGKHAVILSILTKGNENLRAAPDNYTIDKLNYKAPDYGYAGLTYKKPKDNFDRSKMPVPSTNPVVKVPPFYKSSLPNGMKLIGTKNTEVPVVTVSVYLKGGRLLDQNDLSRAGRSALFAAMMEEDTKNRSAEEFARELEAIGSSIDVSSGTDAIVFTMQSVRKHLNKSLELLEERMLMPKFQEASFKRVKGQWLERLKNAQTDASTVADNVYASLNYGESALGVSASGTDETVRSISLKDIEEYYNKYITSEDGRVVVVGDITQAEITPKLKFLAQLPKTSFTIPQLPAARRIEKTTIYVVNIPGAAQTQFRVGAPVPLRYDALGEYYRANLMNYALGTGFSSRINLNLREDKGWTYGARTNLTADKYTGTFTFSSGIRANATDSALYEVLSEIRNYATLGIKDPEIKFMQTSLGQVDARNYETNAQRASFLERMLRYDLPADYVTKQNAILKSITKKDIDALAAKYLDIHKLNIVLVGDRDVITPALARFGYDVVELDARGRGL